jgi:hypothetical protein
MSAVLTIAFGLLIYSNSLADQEVKFDEYGDLPFSEEKARLDNLGIQLKEFPDYEIGWYVIFPGSKYCPGEARRRALRAKNYIVKKHGIRADRVIWTDEGYRETLLVEIWIRPRSSGKPWPTNSATVKRSEVQVSINCKSRPQKRQGRIKL